MVLKISQLVCLLNDLIIKYKKNMIFNNMFVKTK